MPKRDFWLVASSAAAGSLLTYLAFTTLTAPTGPSRPELGAAQENFTPPGNRSIADYSPVQAGEQPTKSVAVPPRLSQSTDSARADGGKPRDPAIAFQQQQQFGKVLSDFLSNAGGQTPGALNATIENRFFTEDWNQEWAGSRERSIRTLFASNDHLSGIEPQQVTCRSKNCQVVLSASNEDQIRRLSAEFMQVATKSDVGMQNQVVSFFPDVSAQRVVFYLSENGNTDLFR